METVMSSLLLSVVCVMVGQASPTGPPPGQLMTTQRWEGRRDIPPFPKRPADWPKEVKFPPVGQFPPKEWDEEDLLDFLEVALGGTPPPRASKPKK